MGQMALAAQTYAAANLSRSSVKLRIEKIIRELLPLT
jgi:hypothetical protein